MSSLVTRPEAAPVLRALGLSDDEVSAGRISAQLYLERDGEYLVVLQPGGSVLRVPKTIIGAVETEALR